MSGSVISHSHVRIAGGQLARLTIQRTCFRVSRILQRMRSPRRIMATSLVLLFFALYLLNGVFILSARTPADPERLRLWLSGGMVIYAVYHAVRCAWTKSIDDMGLTSAEELWLGGAPLKRSSLAVYHLSNAIVPSLLKTLLLAVVLANDVQHLELLVVGVFTSLMLLETTRLIIQRFASGLSERNRARMRLAAALIATAVVLQVLTHLVTLTPAGSPTWLYLLNFFHSLGQTAACETIQWLSLPWIAPAQIAVTAEYQPITLLQLAGTAALLPLAIMILVRVDARAEKRRLQEERAFLENNQFHRPQARGNEIRRAASPNRLQTWADNHLPAWAGDALSVLCRQAISVRQHRSAIAVSFAIPMLLCLSPLFTGQVVEQWFFVVGGIALCTMLLAPPALRLDFRRDLRRMLLLRAMPVRPVSMVLGQLILPTLITCLFQWATIAIAALVTQPGATQIVLWTAMLNALALFTFAAENALFLAFPHHQHHEGVVMMIRAKLTFLGKVAVMILAVALLGGWAITCRNFPEPMVTPALLGGAILGTWGSAVIALAACTSCWKRFDLTLDVPPE